MKEATGELNMTVVIVIAIAALSAFFYFTLWPTIKNNLYAQTKCSNAVCESTKDSDGMVTCNYYVNGKKQGKPFKCVWKG
jgi:hypothetical protein